MQRYKMLNMRSEDGFSRRVRELRKKLKLSQTELGKVVGLHYTHIGRYERGLSRPSGDKLKLLSEALGVTADYLIEGKINEVAQSKLEDKDLLRMFKEIETFQERDKVVIKELIDAFIAKKKIQELARI